MKIALFPGSFDPFTVGHRDILTRALPLFDKIHIGIGNNTQKKYCYSMEKRLASLKDYYSDEPRISIGSYDGLTVGYCSEVGAKFIIRGLRNTTDFEYEKSIAQLNLEMGDVETIFIISAPEYAPISSTIVREILKYNGDVTKYIPKGMHYDW